MNNTKVSMFGCMHDIDMSVMQMESIATDLVFLLKHSGLSRSELATKLGWSKSRVTKVLSGDENLTVRTITSVAECLGYAFDVVFYNENYDQPKQPWHIDKLNKSIRAEPIHSKPQFEFKLKNSKDVFNDLMEGNDADAYISINELLDINKIEILKTTKNIANSKNAFYWDIITSSDYSFISSVEEKG